MNKIPASLRSDFSERRFAPESVPLCFGIGGDFIGRHKQQLAHYVPRYFNDYLAPAKARLKSRKTLRGQTVLHWWDLLRPRGWQMEHCPKLVSKYFGGSRAFAFDRSGDFVVVVGHAWVVKKGEVEREITDEEVYLAVLTYLSSSLACDLLEYFSIQVSGGQLDLSNRYVRNLPIPKLASLLPRDLNELIQIGIRISEGKVQRWPEVDDLVLSVMSG